MEPEMTEPMLIGIDVGTTAVKAALFDSGGQVHRTYARTYPSHRMPPNLVEQDPADWMAHVLAALTDMAGSAKPGQLQGIGLTSQVNSHVFVDDRGQALLPAIIWQDGRCAEEAALLDAQIGMEEKIGWWGAPLPIDASHVLARMAWVKRHHADIWARTRWVMAPKDYCIMQLTGAVVADPMASFGVIDQNLTYVDRLLDLVEGARDRLAPIRSLAEPAGRIKAGLPAAGTPVAVGTMDAWAGMFGTGTLSDGDAMYLSGTSEIIGVVSQIRNPVPGVIAFPRCEGITMHAGPTQAGGASIAWLSNLLGRSPAELTALAQSADRSRDTPIFLPHLQGERAPVWNINSRAAFAGIDSAMGPAEFTLSVMEGVAFSVRLLLESLEASAGVKVASLNAAGGGMASDIWCQIRADILGIPVRRLKNLDAGVLGAAILAGTGAGLYPSIGAAARALVAEDRTFEPLPSLAENYAFAYGKYRDLYGQLEGFNADLVAHRSQPLR